MGVKIILKLGNTLAKNRTRHKKTTMVALYSLEELTQSTFDILTTKPNLHVYVMKNRDLKRKNKICKTLFKSFQNQSIAMILDLGRHYIIYEK